MPNAGKILRNKANFDILVRQMALNLLKRGYSLDEISAVTNPTPAEIEEL